MFSAVSNPGDDRTTGMRDLAIRMLKSPHVASISAAFSDLGWNKPLSQYEIYLSEQQEGIRTVFAGYVPINWSPSYPPYRAGGIPEIQQDFYVLPRFRRQGIGTNLMDQAEQKISERSRVAGIGVGMPPDYGAAQRLYVLRGYVPDGKGLTRYGRPVRQGDEITVNDGFILYLTKTLTEGASSERSPYL